MSMPIGQGQFWPVDQPAKVRDPFGHLTGLDDRCSEKWARDLDWYSIEFLLPAVRRHNLLNSIENDRRTWQRPHVVTWSKTSELWRESHAPELLVAK